MYYRYFVVTLLFSCTINDTCNVKGVDWAIWNQTVKGIDIMYINIMYINVYIYVYKCIYIYIYIYTNKYKWS